MPLPSYIQEVSPAFIDRLSFGDGEPPMRGMFFASVLGPDGEYHIAVNNAQGQGWREEFVSQRTAILWLRGHRVLNRQNQLCDGKTGERILDIAEKVRAETERGK